MKSNDDKDRWEILVREKSLTEFRQQVRSGELPAYLSLKILLNRIVSRSWCYLFKFSPFLRNSTRV